MADRYYVMANGRRISPALDRASADDRAADEARGYQRVDVADDKGSAPVTTWQHGVRTHFAKAHKVPKKK